MLGSHEEQRPVKQVMMIDAKNAHLNPCRKEDLYVELPTKVE